MKFKFHTFVAYKVPFNVPYKLPCDKAFTNERTLNGIHAKKMHAYLVSSIMLKCSVTNYANISIW